MSENTPAEVPASALGPLRTLAVRITDGLRAQLDVLAQLNDRTVTEEIRLALESWVETSKSDPKVLERAETVRAEIEREAKTGLDPGSWTRCHFGYAASVRVADLAAA